MRAEEAQLRLLSSQRLDAVYATLARRRDAGASSAIVETAKDGIEVLLSADNDEAAALSPDLYLDAHGALAQHSVAGG
jgi:hypothetical protein